MFKDIYKAANDDIKASDELLTAILQGKRRKKTPSVLKYSSIAAACAAIAVSIAVAPSLVRKDKSGVIYEESVSATEKPSMSDVLTDSADSAAETEANKAAPSFSVRQGSNYSASKKSTAVTDTKIASANTDDEDTAQISAYSHIEANQSAASDEMSKPTHSDKNSAEPIFNEKSIPQESAKETVDTSVRTVVLHVNSSDYGGSGDLGVEYDSFSVGNDLKTVEWSMDDYFKYLGENVFETLSLPHDFSYVGDYEMTVSVDENGTPTQDSAIFPYEGDGERYVTVITSKNTLTASSYIEDERYVKSDIYGNDAVVIGGDDEYKSYIISNDISHIVMSEGMTEEELGETLVSIGD